MYERGVSELVALIDPIVPILKSLLGMLINLDAFQLAEGNGKLPGFPADEHKHLMLAVICGSQFYDLDFISWF